MQLQCLAGSNCGESEPRVLDRFLVRIGERAHAPVSESLRFPYCEKRARCGLGHHGTAHAASDVVAEFDPQTNIAAKP